MKHGDDVAAFEKAFAAQVGADHAIAMTNGTVTLQVALMALGFRPGDRVATTPLTMAATTIAILNAGCIPKYLDVCPRSWLMAWPSIRQVDHSIAAMPVSLYGLHSGWSGPRVIDDAAQTLRPHDPLTAFTSYSLQRSKILNTGEGGVLVTNDARLADEAREIASLGYKMGGKARIDSAVLKSPAYDRHHRGVSLNARMNDVTACMGLSALAFADDHKEFRQVCAGFYRDAIEGCDWLVPQHVPEGWSHDYWTFAVACDTPARAVWLADAVVRYGGERPFAAWRITYQEPAFKHLAPRTVTHATICPVAEGLQPRLLQLQTNDLASARRNARALRRAIEFDASCVSVDTSPLPRPGDTRRCCGRGVPCG